MKAMTKKPVKKYEMGGFTGGPVNPAAAAAEKQQQQMRQQAALDNAQRASMPAGRAQREIEGRSQTMMAKGGAVKKKPAAALAIMIAMPAKGKGKTKMNMGGMCGSKKK